MQNINIDNLLFSNNIGTYDNQNQHRNHNSTRSKFDTYMSATGIGTAYNEQSITYLDLKELYQAHNCYNAVNNLSKNEAKDISTSQNHKKMVDNLTGVTYYKNNNSSITYENIGDANKFFEELDKFLFDNDKKLRLESFKEFINQCNNGNTQVNFSTENVIDSTENETSSEIITLTNGSRVLVITINFGGSEIKLSLKISEPDKNMSEYKNNDELRSENAGNDSDVSNNMKNQTILDDTDIISSLS